MSEIRVKVGAELSLGPGTFSNITVELEIAEHAPDTANRFKLLEQQDELHEVLEESLLRKLEELAEKVSRKLP